MNKFKEIFNVLQDPKVSELIFKIDLLGVGAALATRNFEAAGFLMACASVQYHGLPKKEASQTTPVLAHFSPFNN